MPKVPSGSTLELIKSDAFRSSAAKIPLALGACANGKPLIADLADMPSLLVAGSTAPEISACLHSMFASMVCHFSPTELQLLLLGEKAVEFQLYQTLPHLITPIVSYPKQALRAPCVGSFGKWRDATQSWPQPAYATSGL